MGKSARARKAKKADFQKVKLKVGKKLKKAQNETKTDFKTQKIILKEQLALKSTKTLVTKKQHDIKELLSRLNYHNVYVRQDGVNGLRELVNRYEPSVLIPHLSTFIMRGSPCILDSDPLIRSSATKFLEALIVKMGPSIEPYFMILATHLSCAMVHLNVGVQGDSLELMRVLIKHTPTLVARHANTVLTNFINLISRKVASGKNSVQEEPLKPIARFSFTHLIQPVAKKNQGTPMGRLALIVELSNFLEAILTEQSRTQEEIPLTMWETVVAGSIPPITWDDNQNKTEELWLFTDVEKLKDFTNTIIKLLMQLWLEVDSDSIEDSSAGGNAISEEGVEVLSCIVSIISHIWCIIRICTQTHPKKCLWLKSHFTTGFMTRIMNGFPFCCHVTPVQGKKRKKNREAEQTSLEEQEKQRLKHCDDLNVLLASFGTQMSFTAHKAKSLNYLSQLLRDGTRDGQYSMSAVIRVLKELLHYSGKPETQSVVASAHSCYTRLHPLKKDRSLLLEILLEATDFNHTYLLSNPSVIEWVKNIVKDLASGSVREPLLNAAIELRLRNNTEIKSLLLLEKERIKEAVRSHGIQGLSSSEVDRRLNFLLKD